MAFSELLEYRRTVRCFVCCMGMINVNFKYTYYCIWRSYRNQDGNLEMLQVFAPASVIAELSHRHTICPFASASEIINADAVVFTS